MGTQRLGAGGTDSSRPRTEALGESFWERQGEKHVYVYRHQPPRRQSPQPGPHTHRRTAPQPREPGRRSSLLCKCPRPAGSQRRFAQPVGDRRSGQARVSFGTALGVGSDGGIRARSPGDLRRSSLVTPSCPVLLLWSCVDKRGAWGTRGPRPTAASGPVQGCLFHPFSKCFLRVSCYQEGSPRCECLRSRN